MERRLITAAEAALLLTPKSSTAGRCIEAAMLTLLGAGLIDIERSTGLFKEAALRLTTPSAGRPASLPGHVTAVEQALAAYGKGDRLNSSQVNAALQKSFGSGYIRYVHDEVAPGLIKRGLLQRTNSKLLGIFPKIRYERTPSGAALIGPIERLMAALDKVPSLIRSDPDEALRLALSAGVLLVMSSAAREKIPKLRKLLSARSGDSGGIVYAASGGAEDSEIGQGELGQAFQLGDMALAFNLLSLFDGVQAVSEFTSGGDGSDGGDGGGGGGD